MNAFGPAIATYRGNKIVIAFSSVLALGCAFLAWMSLHASEADSPGDYRLYLVAAILLAANVVRIWKRQVELHAEGISYRSLFGEKQMRWDALQKFYYSATKRSVNFIPIGTYYTYKLIDQQGTKIVLGNGIEHPKDLGLKLVELTTPFLLKKTAHEFNSGLEVDFGRIKLNREKGLTVRKLLGGWKTVPLTQVYSYQIQLGQFCLYSADGKLIGAAGIADVPNAFVLQALLDSILAPKAQTAHAN